MYVNGLFFKKAGATEAAPRPGSKPQGVCWFCCSGPCHNIAGGVKGFVDVSFCIGYVFIGRFNLKKRGTNAMQLFSTYKEMVEWQLYPK